MRKLGEWEYVKSIRVKGNVVSYSCIRNRGLKETMLSSRSVDLWLVPRIIRHELIGN